MAGTMDLIWEKVQSAEPPHDGGEALPRLIRRGLLNDLRPILPGLRTKGPLA